MTLLLDLGNTRLKWASSRGGGLDAVGACAWDSEALDSRVADAWRELPPPLRVLAASVVSDERERRLEQWVHATFGLPVQWLRTPAAGAGVRNAYPQPGHLGVDRFLGMVAARAAGAAPCVVVGVGTALTLDALAADGRHLGGLIAPSPRLMEQAVLGATAQVRPQHPGRVVDAADNTADGLHAGCWQAAAALVERFHRRMQPQLGAGAGLRLSGGDAQALAALIEPPAECVADAVLLGLAAWAAQE